MISLCLGETIWKSKVICCGAEWVHGVENHEIHFEKYLNGEERAKLEREKQKE